MVKKVWHVDALFRLGIRTYGNKCSESGPQGGGVALPVSGDRETQPVVGVCASAFGLAVEDRDESVFHGVEKNRSTRADDGDELLASDGAELDDACLAGLGSLSGDDESVEGVREFGPGFLVGAFVGEVSVVVEQVDAVGEGFADGVEAALPVGALGEVRRRAEVDAHRSGPTGVGELAHCLHEAVASGWRSVTVERVFGRVHGRHHAVLVSHVFVRCPLGLRLMVCQFALGLRRHGMWRGDAGAGHGGRVIPNSAHTALTPREVALRGATADDLVGGLDMMQGTRTLRQTHTKAPDSVVAMARTSLRSPGALSMLPRRSERGYASPRKGVEMT